MTKNLNRDKFGNVVMILDSRSLFSNANYDLAKKIIMLAIDNRSSAHVNNSKKDILVLVKVQHMNKIILR